MVVVVVIVNSGLYCDRRCNEDVVQNDPIDIAMQDVLVKLSLFVAANNATLGDMPLGSIVDLKQYRALCNHDC